MVTLEPHPGVDTIPPEQGPEVNTVMSPLVRSLTTKKIYKDRLTKMLQTYRMEKKTIMQLRQWLKEEVRVKKMKAELETIGTQTEYFPGEDVGTQIETLLVYSKETQTEPCLLEDSEMQTKDPCVYPHETQIDFPIVDVVVQIDTRENSQDDYCMIRDVTKVVVQTDPM